MNHQLCLIGKGDGLAATLHISCSCRAYVELFDHKFLKILINVNERLLSDKLGFFSPKLTCINKTVNIVIIVENTSGGFE